MRRVKLTVTLSAALVMAAAVIGLASPTLASYVERVLGVVQDWSVERGFIVVDGVRYQTSEDVYLSDETGLSIPFSRLKIGARVSLLEHDGLVYEIALLQEEQ